MVAAHPANETLRLAVLRASGLLDSAPEAAFDDVTRLANLICGTPMAAVTLVDEHRQWLKAKTGMDVCETSRDHAFCAHAILSPGELLEVRDASVHPWFFDNPYVTGAPGLRFYAGVPLVVAPGVAIGSICVLDTMSRELTAGQRDGLRLLAAQLVREIEARQLAACASQRRAALEDGALVARIDQSGRLVEINDNFCALLGRRRDELLDPDRPVGEAGHPAAEIFREGWASFSAGRSWSGEVRLGDPGKNESWVQLSIVPVRDGSGRAGECLVIGQDVGEARRVEAQMRRAERWSHELIEALPMPIYTTDAQGRLTMFNRAAVEFAGRVPRLGVDSWCLSHSLFRADGLPMRLEESSMAQSLRLGREVRHTEAVAVRPDGTKVNFIPCPTLLRDEAGKVIGGLNVLVDVTEQRRSEEMLRLLSSAMEQTQESIIITDANLHGRGPRILYVNAAFTALTGFAAEQVLGRSPGLLTRFGAVRGVLRAMRDALARGETYDGEFQNRRADGAVFDAHWRITPVRDARGRVVRLVGIQRDVTERNAAALELMAAREAALESSRLKSSFLTNMSHELRTPLNAINGLSATLLETELPESTRQVITMILQCGESLLENIQTILTHSSLEAGKTVLECKPFRLSEVVLHARRITADAARRKKLDVICEFDPALAADWMGDAFRLQQVLVNLVANAIKFTSRGYVRVRLRRARPGRSGLRLTVADTGIGIAPRDQRKLFKPFSQADDSSTRRFEGSGLGLAITKSLVELMGGRIRLMSRSGRGTVFCCDLPLASVAESPAFFARSAHAALAGRVVAIEDGHPLRRRKLAAWARAWGMGVAESAPAGGTLDVVVRRWSAAREEDRADASGVPIVWLSESGVASSAVTDEHRRLVHDPYAPEDLSAALVAVLKKSRSAAPFAPSPDRPAKSRSLRILAADDIPANLKVLSIIAGHLGYQPDLVENGAEVLARLETHTYDLILLDVQMPVLDGIATTRRICELYPDKTTRPRIVAVTAGAQPEERTIGLAAGMDDYLVKPLLPRQLAACIASLFDDDEADPGETRTLPMAAPVGSEPASDWIDHSHLGELSAGLATGEATEMLRRFHIAVCADFEANFSRLVRGCAERRVDDVRATVHALRGCVASVGWSRLGAFLADASAQLKEPETVRWDEIPARAEPLFKSSRAAMERVLAERTPASSSATRDGD